MSGSRNHLVISYQSNHILHHRAENEQSHQAKKNAGKAQQLKSELKALIAEPLVARGISRRYITSGSRAIVDDLVGARNHKDMVGLPKISAGEDVGEARK